MPQTATRRSQRLPLGARAASAQSYNAEARTVEIVAATETPVRMPGWQLGLDIEFYLEILDCSERAVDLSQIEAGNCPLLDSHNRWSMDDRLGVIQSGRLEGGQLLTLAALGQSEHARSIEAEIQSNTPPKASVGYRREEVILERFEGDVPVYRVTRWAVREVSFVPIAADPAAGVRAEDDSHPCVIMETRAMPQENTAAAEATASGAVASAQTTQAARAEQTTDGARGETSPGTQVASDGARAAPAGIARFTATQAVEFEDQARAFGVETQARNLITQNERGEISVEAARSAILQAAAERQRAGTSAAPGGAVAAGSAGRAGDEMETSRRFVVEALVARTFNRAPAEGMEGAREFMGLRLLEVAAARAGLRNERDPTVILRAAHTTSDFPMILEAASNRVMMERYTAQPPTYRAISRQRNLRDFKPTKLLRIGDFPTLQKYREDGEIKAGTIAEGRETVTLGSYGRIVRLTRQAIINDDLGAFDEVFGSIGSTVALFENATFYAMKASFSGAGPKLADGKSVFHADHGNLAGSGTTITIPALGAGRAAIRKQKNLDGQVMNLTPRILLVGADSETLAEQVTSPLQPQQAGNVNPFSGRLQVVTEGSIEGYDWELYADPAQAPVFNHGYLADAPGPRILMEEPFNVDGMAFRVTLDFYCGAVDSRGAYRNPGAAPA